MYISLCLSLRVRVWHGDDEQNLILNSLTAAMSQLKSPSNHAPQVSVIMPVHNGETYLRQAIGSVLAQSLTNFELIVIDDGSTDETAVILFELARSDPRIVPVTLPTNMGAGMSRNTGINQAVADYIAFLDADDTWHRKKLQTQLDWMMRNDSVFSCTAYMRVSVQTGQQRQITPPRRVNREQLLRGNSIACSTVMCTRKALGQSRFPPLRMRQDFALWLDVLTNVPYCDGMTDCLTTYHRHTGNLSSGFWRPACANWKLYRQHLGLSVLQSLAFLTSHTLKAFLRRVLGR